MPPRPNSYLWSSVGLAAGGLLVLSGVIWSLHSSWQGTEYLAAAPSLAGAELASSTPTVPAVVHHPTPESVRALYMTQCASASPSLREHLLKLADETEINSIVVDLKDYSGTVVFPSATALPGGAGCRNAHFGDLVQTLHDHDLYVIGRLTVFQDPLYTKVHPEEAVQSLASGGVWRDRKGLAFVDVSSPPFHDYIVALAREAEQLGVDEINFDYIRYPSDGNMKDTKYIETGKTHAENLEDFFKYLSSTLHASSSTPVLSADLFGMTTTNLDDLNIGQVLERALPYFDFIDPMVYPSHYPPNFNGWANPNQHPYDIVKFSLERAVARTVATTTPIGSLAYDRVGTSTPALYQKPTYPAGKIRPWLQDFDYPVTYTPEMVKTQMEATYDAGLTSWLLWDPKNEYTREALQ